MNYAIVTFGCRVNQADSLQLEREFLSRGGVAVSPDHADLVVVNTCSVTASADQGARQTIRRIARENPAVRIVATGCYATRCPEEVSALPGVAVVVRNDDKTPATFFRRATEASDAIAGLVQNTEGACGRTLGPGLMGRTSWTLRVQTGCQERCSYCIIPTTRGASRSRPLDEVLDEVGGVIASGYREIVVSGVHLGSYGRDLSPRSSLSVLCASLAARAEAVARPEGLAFIGDDPRLPSSCEGHALRPGDPTVLFRISSLEPMDFPLEILEYQSIAPHFHLPLQHASDRMLAAMRRPYTLDYYRRLVDNIRNRQPHAAIGSDILVGFPGESDDDLATLTAYLESSPLTHLHVFPYSDRPGTAASGLPGKVHGSIVKERAQTVRAISRVLAERFRESQRGTVRPALTIEDGTVAVTDNYFRVSAPPGHNRNEVVTAVL